MEIEIYQTALERSFCLMDEKNQVKFAYFLWELELSCNGKSNKGS